jgi:hypothetical protein
MCDKKISKADIGQMTITFDQVMEQVHSLAALASKLKNDGNISGAAGVLTACHALVDAIHVQFNKNTEKTDCEEIEEEEAEETEAQEIEKILRNMLK